MSAIWEQVKIRQHKVTELPDLYGHVACLRQTAGLTSLGRSH